jgi:hypothetical protein
MSMRVFCAAINRLGRRTGSDWRDVTPRKIETWTAEKLLTSPERPGRGQGRGRTAVYNAGLVLEALEVALLMRHHSADDVALIRYANGGSFNPERVRRAYVSGVERWHRGIEEASAAGRAAFNHDNLATTDTPQPVNPAEIAEWSESVLARRIMEHPHSGEIRRLLREAGQQPRAVIEATTGGAAGVLLGAEHANPDDMLNLIGWAGGAPPPEVQHAARETFEDLIAIGRFENIQTVIQAATPHRFDRAREIYRYQQRLSNGPLFDLIEASNDVRGAFKTAVARTQAFAGELRDADAILGLLIMMHYHLLPRCTE